MANGNGSGKLVLTLIGILGSALGFSLAQFTAASDASAGLRVLTERVGHLNTQIQAGMDDRYRGSDARRDFALVKQQIEQNAKQIEELHVIMRGHDNNETKHK